MSSPHITRQILSRSYDSYVLLDIILSKLTKALRHTSNLYHKTFIEKYLEGQIFCVESAELGRFLVTLCLFIKPIEYVSF